MFVLATGMVSWAWSEVGFWAHFRTDDNPAVWVLTALLYTTVAYLVLRVVRRYPVHGLASVFLVGGLYGWLVEGTVATTVYLALPFSLVWTGLAWHALLTVVIGWWALPRALQRGGWAAVAWCASTGAAWGLWSAVWWGAPPDGGQRAATFQPVSYTVFVAIVTGVTAVGYGLQYRCRPQEPDLASTWTPWVLLGVLGLWALAVVFVPQPWALAVLAPLMFLAVRSIRRLVVPSAETVPGPTAGDVLGWTAGVPWRQLPAFAAVPLAAVGTYLALSPLRPVEPGTGAMNAIFLVIITGLCLAGGGLLVVSLWTAWRRPGGYSQGARLTHEHQRHQAHDGGAEEPMPQGTGHG